MEPPRPSCLAANRAVPPRGWHECSCGRQWERKPGWEPWTWGGGGQAAGASPSPVLPLRHREDGVMETRILRIS